MTDLHWPGTAIATVLERKGLTDAAADVSLYIMSRDLVHYTTSTWPEVITGANEVSAQTYSNLKVKGMDYLLQKQRRKKFC